MGSKEEMQEKYFTSEGIKALSTLLTSYLSLFNNKTLQYPLNLRFWGFPQSQFDNEAELYGRIKLVSDLMAIPITVRFVEETYEDKSTKIQCYIDEVKDDSK